MMYGGTEPAKGTRRWQSSAGSPSASSGLSRPKAASKHAGSAPDGTPVFCSRFSRSRVNLDSLPWPPAPLGPSPGSPHQRHLSGRELDREHDDEGQRDDAVHDDNPP